LQQAFQLLVYESHLRQTRNVTSLFQGDPGHAVHVAQGRGLCYLVLDIQGLKYYSACVSPEFGGGTAQSSGPK
jgi:hypothetical protein